MTMRLRAKDLVDRSESFLSVEDFANIAVNRVVIAELVSEGLLVKQAWGIYLPSHIEPSEHLNLALLSFRNPGVVMSHLTAAAFHGVTQEMPQAITCFVSRDKGSTPKMGSSFTEEVKYIVTRRPENLTVGVRPFLLDGVAVNVTGKERTLVDFYRYCSLGSGYDPVVSKEAFFDVMHRVCSGSGYLEELPDYDLVDEIAMEFGVLEGLSDHLRPYRTNLIAPSA